MSNKPSDVCVSRELKCWSCKAVFTLSDHADCDGCCWKCGVEIDLAEMDIQPADQQGEPVPVAWMRFDDDQRAIFTRSKRSKNSEALYAHPTAYRHAQPAMAKVVLPEGFMIVERSIWTEQQVAAATASITLLKGVLGMTDRDLALAAMDAAQCKAPDISLDEVAKLNGGQS
ncbi:hypothetical protein [Pseudomonas syringae]|uniref:hypothetical protein n=1 Tax=Pseudomonas syringae TaxID=317 RepID=UPI001EFD1F73|nr:hypothetical protein [Pseudomonas syringae]